MVAINALIPRQRLFDGVPTSVPFTYRDGLTTLQLVECLRKNLDIVQSQANDLADKFNDYEQSNEQDKTVIRNELDKVQQQIDDINDRLGDLSIINDVWNVTKGRYTDSRTAMRDTYRELAVFGARVNQVATLTVSQLAEHTVNEVSAIGNYTIFKDDEPRVTDPQTGKPYDGQ